MNKIILMGTLLIATVVSADIKVSDVEATYGAGVKIEAVKGLQQGINLGFANTTGNTETLNLNGKYTLGYSTEGYASKALNIAFNASAFLTKSNDVTDNEEYSTNLGLEQYITDNDWLAYANASWLRNTFRNFDNKFLFGAGLGKELFNDEQHIFKAKVGIAYNIEEYTNNQAEHKFTSLTEYIKYDNKLNKTSLLYIKLGASQNFDDFSDYEILAVAGFNFTVAENLNVTIEEEIRYDELPPIGFDTTDTKSIVRVGYTF
jgi:putative salt-induced outer membrane protein YdiY